MATLDQFLPYVEPHVLGAPIPGILHEIRATLIDFCERTRVWKDSTVQHINSEEATYSLNDDCENRDLILIEEVCCEGSPLPPITLADLSLVNPDGCWAEETGTPTAYTQLSPDAIRLVPIPELDVDEGLSIIACWKPSRTAEVIADNLFEYYADAISHGVIARLLETRGNPYGDPKLGTYHREMYEVALYSHAAVASKNFTRAPLRTKGDF